MKLSNLLVILSFCVFAGFFLSSCAGSGESGNSSTSIGLSALILPEKVSVVDPQDSGGGSKPQAKTGPLILSAISMSDLAQTTDYMSDKVTVYVNERSLESFRSVNEILCMLRQSRYDAMINKGPYKAQVDKNLCNTNRSDASSAGESSTNQTSGSAMPDYEAWTVNSHRSNANAPHVVDAWVHTVIYSVDEGQDVPAIILAKVVITEGADTAPPYGLFKANFRALDTATMTERFTGFLNAELDPDYPGKILLRFSTEDKDLYSIEKATLYKNPNGSDGAGSVYSAVSNSWTSAIKRFNVAYDDNYFLRKDHFSPSSVCLERKNPDISAWKYGLYTTTGQRVNVNSGFPIKKDNTYGWVGYWGIWMPETVVVNDGNTVYKYDYATKMETAYTVRKAGGKLKKHTQKPLLLGDIKNVPLVWGDATGTYFVAWTGSDFAMISKLSTTNNTWDTCGGAAACPAKIDLANLSWTELGFWTPSLSGYAIVKFPGPPMLSTAPTSTSNCGYDTPNAGKFDCSLTASDSRDVILYAESVVFPGDPVPSTFACFDNCPDTTLMNTSNPFHPNNSYQPVAPAVATYYAYTLDSSTMELKEGTTPVTEVNPDSRFNNGITSGLLFDRSKFDPISGKTYIELLGCDWPGETCGYKAWSVLPEFYTWETGPNEWNKFVWVENAGVPERFDPPLRVEYRHVQLNAAAPDSKFNNVKFFLEYSGFGDLHGIPGKCVNIDDPGLPNVDCSNSGSDPAIRWVPEFTIPDIQNNGNLTEVTAGATTYIVKALEKEERMKSALGQCGHLTATPYTLPSMRSYIEPIIGTEPTVTGAPAVIGGVVQE